MIPAAPVGSTLPEPTNLVALSPEILEPRRRQLGITHGVLDVLVAEVGLQGARVMATRREITQLIESLRLTSEPDLRGVRSSPLASIESPAAGCHPPGALPSGECHSGWADRIRFRSRAG
jgi:hypothetical protein